MTNQERDHTKMSLENLQAAYDVIAEHLSRKYDTDIKITVTGMKKDEGTTDHA